MGADEITRFFSKGIGKLRGTISVIIRGMPPAPVAEVREDALADLIAMARARAGEATRQTTAGWADEPATRGLVAADPGLWAVLPGFDAALRTRLEGWIAGIGEDVQRSGGQKRLLARGASVGVNAAGTGVMLATFLHTGGLTGAEVGVAAATAFLNQKLLEALFGEVALAEMISRARLELGEAFDAAFAEELNRYGALIPDGGGLRALSAQLRQAAGDLAALREHGRRAPG